MFRQCQLQWFLKTKVANAKAKDPVRREAYLLSKLQSLWAWRGHVADQLLGAEIAKALYSRHPIHLDNLLRQARSSFALQADFARRHRIREPGMSPAKAGVAFAAWHAIEYVEPITDADIEMAWAMSNWHCGIFALCRSFGTCSGQLPGASRNARCSSKASV
jgi:hypothetical protein